MSWSPSSIASALRAVSVVDADRGALGQAHLEEQLGPLRQREELLLHAAEGDDRAGEDADRRDDRDAAPVTHALHDRGAAQR